jgi:hypothetical protein
MRQRNFIISTATEITEAPKIFTFRNPIPDKETKGNIEPRKSTTYIYFIALNLELSQYDALKSPATLYVLPKPRQASLRASLEQE